MINFPSPWEGPSDILKIEVNMRGRTFSDGKPDLSGWELQDWIDAVNFVRTEYKKYISDPAIVYAEGGSGAGGNVYALLGKFPDFFTAAFVHAGMSDYLDLYLQDEPGEFIDEMEGEGWIGGSPESNPGGYHSRGGITTVQNLLTPLQIDHGETDIRVPVSQARNYVKAARTLNKVVRYIEWPGVGDKQHWSNMTNGMNEYLSYLTKDWLKRFKKPPEISAKGKFIISGYIKTKNFDIILDSIDRIGSVDYFLTENRLPQTFLIDVSPFTTIRLDVPLPDTLKLDVKTIGGEILVNKVIGNNWKEISIKNNKKKVNIYLNYTSSVP